MKTITWLTLPASAILFVCVTTEFVTAAPNLYVSNNLTNNDVGGRVLSFNGTTGQFQSLLGNVSTPRGLKVGPDGSLYVASANDDSIIKFAFNNGIQQSTFVPAGSGGLDFPQGIEFGPDGNLYVTSGFLSTNVLKYDGTTGSFLGTFATFAGESSGDLLFGPNGNLYLATFSSGVYQYNGQTGAPIGNFVSAANFTFASGITFGPDQNFYIATGPSDSVLRFNGNTGAFIDAFVAANSGGLDDAAGLAFGPDGNLYVAGLFNDAIIQYSGQTGAYINVFASTPIDAPVHLLFNVPEPCTWLLGVAAFVVLPLLRRR